MGTWEELAKTAPDDSRPTNADATNIALQRARGCARHGAAGGANA